jgi:hypothetical protein
LTGQNNADRLLYQLYDQYMCGQMIESYVRETGVRYKYAIRLRPDLAFVAPFPDVRTLNLGTDARPIVRYVTHEMFYVPYIYTCTYVQNCVYAHMYACTYVHTLKQYIHVHIHGISKYMPYL